MVHPCQLVSELFASRQIAIRQVNVRDANVLHDEFKKTSMAICFIANKGRADDLKWLTRQNGNPVVCLLSHGSALVPERLKQICQEFCALEFLQQQDIV